MSLSLRFSLVLVGMLALVTVGRAETYSCSDANAYPMDTLAITCTADSATTAPYGWKVSGASIYWEETVMLTAGGASSLVIPVGSVQFLGSGADSLNAVSTASLFQFIGGVSVRRALDSGSISAPSPGNWKTVHVYQAGCVARTGSGGETHFTDAGSGCCVKTYVIATPNGGGSPTIAFVGSNGPNCSGAYESTCDEGSNLSFLNERR